MENGNGDHSQRIVKPSRSSIVKREVSSDDPQVAEEARQKLELARKMQLGLKEKTRDRRWRDLKVYKECFLHNDAIAWLKDAYSLKTDEEAVRIANQLVDMNYVSHVCNSHRFTPNEKRTLYFTFHQDVMDADLQSLTQHRSIMLNYVEDLEVLTTKVERLTAEMLENGRVLNETYGRVSMLEAIVVSLAFSITVLVFITFALLLKGTISRDRFGNSTYLVTFAAAVLVPITLVSGRNAWMNRVTGNVAIMGRLISLDDTIMMDVESDDESTTSSQLRVRPKRRESFVEMLSRAMSQPKLVREIEMREASDLPETSSWPHRPVLLCANTPVSPSLNVPKYGAGPCPLGVPFHFSTDLFEGVCLVRLRDVPSDDPDGDALYFDGRKRRFQGIVQGRFKEALCVADVMTGHEFRPLKRLPPSWLIRAGTSFIRRIAPGTDIVLDNQQSRAMSILAATSQEISVDQPGNEPEITSNTIEEDMSLFGGKFASGEMSTYKRKQYLAVPKNAAKYHYDTESVYTFDFYQNLLDVATYSLDLGSAKISLTKFLDGQPIQVMSRTMDGRYLWDFQVWHEKLLPKVKESAVQ